MDTTDPLLAHFDAKDDHDPRPTLNGPKRKCDDATCSIEATADSTSVAVDGRHVRPRLLTTAHSPPEPETSPNDCSLWTDSLLAPTVWALVFDQIARDGCLVDRSGCDRKSREKRWRAAQSLSLLGAACRLLYEAVGALDMRRIALCVTEQDTHWPQSEASTSVLWRDVVILRADERDRSVVIDVPTDTINWHMRHLVKCEVSLAPICDSRAIDDNSATLLEQKADNCHGSLDQYNHESDDDCHESDDDSEDEDDKDSDDDGDRVEGGALAHYSLDIADYPDLWDSVDWDDDANGNKDEDIYEDDFDDSHEDEYGTISDVDDSGNRWTLCVFSHYRNGLYLVGVKVDQKS